MTGRAQRADARRNQERLVDAARDAFAAHGPDASLNDIARRAGVGAGTLYRHFPTREALQAAVLTDRVQRLSDHAAELRTSAAPGPALSEWLRAFLVHAGTDHGLSGRMLVAEQDGPAVDCHRLIRDAAADLLAAAQHAGAARADVTPDDVLLLVTGVALVTAGQGAVDDRPGRLLGIVLDALRPSSLSRRTPAAPPSAAGSR
ncbi:TetR/AcrR family transcriptional regulator [Pseudonocardia kunmingensis]|uniref:TetR family transcriptional regulator n=1 Tax=Pseudonocardia kunmingensis TaxID=630975 RepID=A0A543DJ95_9PSEU|nr:TetR/AcrR family transcriptional regulator [Pseudonocardia kunmingensis]TQM09383.1 TetR family transcriptional regulator [Pseudonocardia kunmingensis]